MMLQDTETQVDSESLSKKEPKTSLERSILLVSVSQDNASEVPVPGIVRNLFYQFLSGVQL